MTDTTDVQVTRNDDESRYEATVGGELAGVIEFADRDGSIEMTHTEVRDEFQGKGVASALASEALADVASRSGTVIPSCSYVARYLSKHDVPGLTVADS